MNSISCATDLPMAAVKSFFASVPSGSPLSLSVNEIHFENFYLILARNDRKGNGKIRKMK